MARILIVDDEPLNQEVAQVICEALGHDVVVRQNGQEAIAVLQSEAPFDLVLMDVVMPVLDGISATKVIRSTPATAKIPVLGMTARASQKDWPEMIAAGMNAVLTKPYKNRELAATITSILKGQAAE